MAFLGDLRFSARSFARTPGAALMLVITIALGIGANASVQGFVRGLIARDHPLPGIDDVVSVFARDAYDGFGPVSFDGYLALKRQVESLGVLGAVRESEAGVVVGGRSTVMSVAAVTPDIADLLQLPSGDGVVVSHRAWQSAFGSKAGVRGERIRLDGVEVRVAGVAPEWLEGLYTGRAIDIWTPLREAAVQGVDRRSPTFWALGRLRPGVSAAQAQAAVNAARRGADVVAVAPYTGMTPELSSGVSRAGAVLRGAAGVVVFIACANVATFLLARASGRAHETAVRVALGAGRGRLARQLLADSVLVSAAGGAFGLLLGAWTARIVPALLFDQDAAQLVFAPDWRGIVVSSAACVAITIACGLLPLFETRHDDPAAVLQRESAGPSHAMRRLRAGLVVAQLTCCCVLAIATGLLLTGFRTALQTRVAHRLGRPILATLEARGRFDRPELGLDYFRDAERVARAVPGVTGAVWVGRPPGSRPAWQPIRVELPQRPLRDVELDVAAFTPLSLPLVTLPPIAGRMFSGADTPQACKVVVVNKEAADGVFEGDAVGRSIEDPAGERVEIIGVIAMRGAPTKTTTKTKAPARPMIFYDADQTGTPLDRLGPSRFRVPLRPKPPDGVLDANVVSPGYFDAMGLATAEGRTFPERPAPRGCRVGVINQEAADLYFGGHAVGGAIIDGEGRRTEIVGVVHSTLLRASQRRAVPAIYFPMAQDFVPRMTLVLGAHAPDEALVDRVRRRLDGVVGGRGPVTVTTLDAHLTRTALAPERIATVLVGASAATAFTLGVLGAYGAMAESARRRRREIALRIALGAQSWRVIRQVLGEGLRLAGAGTVSGLIGSLAAARWLARVTPGAGSLSVWMWLGAPLVLVAVVAIASVLPARRAVSVDPLTILRDA